jgi:uncharacterized membrane protein YedE/YeeE
MHEAFGYIGGIGNSSGLVIFAAGILLGFLLHRSDYCMAGMFRDIFLFKDSPLLRVFLIQVFVTMFLFYLGRASGLLELYPPPNLREASFITLAGGFIFGSGMVLAGGCVMGSLYKMGAGNVGSLFAFTGLIIGSGLYAEVYPLFFNLHKDTIIVKDVLLGQVFSNGEDILFIFLMVLLSLVILGWIKKGRIYQKAYAEGYIQPWVTAVLLSFINLLIYVTSQTPMAISTAYAKLAAYTEKLFVPAHYTNLEFFRRLSYSVYSSKGNLIEGGPGAQIDHIFVVEISLLMGIVFGSFMSALSLREFRILKKLPPLAQLISAFAGGLLLGFSSRMAGGCNVKFLMSGLPMLSIQAMVFLLGLVPGSYLGTILFKRFVIGDKVTVTVNSPPTGGKDE